MTTDTPNQEWKRLEFLWDKWKLGDQQMYSRLQVFLVIQAAYVAALGLFVGDDSGLGKGVAGAVTVLSFFAGLASFLMAQMTSVDRAVRDSFSQRLCETLRAVGLRGEECTKENSCYWHHPGLSREQGSGARWGLAFMRITGGLECLLGAVFFVVLVVMVWP